MSSQKSSQSIIQSLITSGCSLDPSTRIKLCKNLVTAIFSLHTVSGQHFNTALNSNMEKIILQLPLILLVLHIQSGSSSDSPVHEIAEAPKPEVVEFNNTIYATCEVNPVPNLPPSQPQIFGQVLFKQIFPNGTLEVKIHLRGLPADDQQARAIHIHQYGDLSQGCVTAGPHYNPRAVDHPGHPGDLGNFVSEQGVIRKFQKLPEAKLFGGESILGRAVVVHEKEDDLGMGTDEESKRSGNAGKRIAGCVIGITTPSLWQKTEGLPREEVEEGNE